MLVYYQIDNIRLFKGTRQECPLAPLLFNLALATLSRYLSKAAPLYGVHIGRFEVPFLLMISSISPLILM